MGNQNELNPEQPLPQQPGQPQPPNNPNEDSKKNIVNTIQQLGQTNVPAVETNIHCLSIVGQIEGHVVLPPQNKTTKYEHIIPQIVAAEQKLIRTILPVR